MKSWTSRQPAWLRTIAMAVFLAFLSCAGASAASAKTSGGPCDILKDAGTPCIAAHSTTRALYAAYNGPLYQLQRTDGRTRDIGVVVPGGIADAGAQDAFCDELACDISMIYDQSPQHNDLTVEAKGTQGKANYGARADALPVTLGGHRVYGLKFDGRMGYRNNQATGTARNGESESMMMVTSALNVNTKCCFDYGNTEITNVDTGEGHMDALYFGARCKPGQKCLGGPWVAADLENGLYQSADGGNDQLSYRGNTTPFVTAFLKNDGHTFFELRSADAQKGPLTQIYHGPLPTAKPGYVPMQQEGGIVLGTGGDNSNRATGLFFEGWMTKGLTTQAAEDAVQANIVAAGYGGLQLAQ